MTEGSVFSLSTTAGGGGGKDPSQVPSPFPSLWSHVPYQGGTPVSGPMSLTGGGTPFSGPMSIPGVPQDRGTPQPGLDYDRWWPLKKKGEKLVGSAV